EEYVRERRGLADELRRVLPEAHARAAAADLEFRCPAGPPAPRKPAEGRPCRWPWGRTVVTVRSEVLPCPYGGGPEGTVLGRLLSSDGEPTQSFAEIWNGPAMGELRERIRRGENPAFCRACYPGWEGPGSTA
ncbi:MAG: SPASM domain-containing protein, partial [Armatimonadota bacterium]